MQLAGRWTRAAPVLCLSGRLDPQTPATVTHPDHRQAAKALGQVAQTWHVAPYLNAVGDKHLDGASTSRRKKG